MVDFLFGKDVNYPHLKEGVSLCKYIMKKIVSLMLATLAIVSCEYRSEAEIEEAKRLNGFNIVVIDSCEYIVKTETYGHQGFGFFAHKGNCRYCKERRERERK